jgi:hypothetical protein
LLLQLPDPEGSMADGDHRTIAVSV